MGATSNIEWTDATWNPVTGCTKVSAGCAQCYAEPLARRLRAMGQPNYQDGFAVRVHPHMLDVPFIWKKPRVVFVNSMGDLFHEEVSEDFIQKVFDTMARADWHRYLVLTKRDLRMASMAPNLPWPGNVWMGVTVESNRHLDRVARLKETPAAVKFISAEPLLGPLPDLELTGIDWVIVGGESGPGARPMDPAWVRDLRDQCVSAGVPFFFKQWGGVRKKAAGRVLDGRTWDERPAPTGPECRTVPGGGKGMLKGNAKADDTLSEEFAEFVATTFHEAGHAVLFHALGGRVHHVSAIPNRRQRSAGSCRQDRHWEYRWGQGEAQLLSTLAGVEAEREVHRNAELKGTDEDEARVLAVWEILRLRSFAARGSGDEGDSMVPEIGRDEIATYLSGQIAKVRTLLKLKDPPVMQAIGVVVGELLERGHLRGCRRLAELCESAGLKAGCLFQVLTPPPGANLPHAMVGQDPVSLMREACAEVGVPASQPEPTPSAE